MFTTRTKLFPGWALLPALPLLVAFLALPVLLHAHAILERSTPTAGSTITGPDLQVKLYFNARIDAKLSQIELTTASGGTQTLPLDPQRPLPLAHFLAIHL